MSETNEKKRRKDRDNGAETAFTESATQATPATESFPTSVQRKLKGRIFTVQFKPEWVEGHVISREEALFMNVSRAGYITSAFSDIYAALTADTDEGKAARARHGFGDNSPPLSDSQIDSYFQGYAESYEWSQRGEGSSLDPVVAEMRKIAKAELTHQLKLRNKTLVGMDKETQKAAIDHYLEKHEKRIKEEAEANIAKAQAFADEDFLAQLGARELSAGAPAS